MQYVKSQINRSYALLEELMAVNENPLGIIVYCIRISCLCY